MMTTYMKEIQTMTKNGPPNDSISVENICVSERDALEVD